MSVKQFLDVNNRHTPFKNNMPGIDFVIFMGLCVKM